MNYCVGKEGPDTTVNTTESEERTAEAIKYFEDLAAGKETEGKYTMEELEKALAEIRTLQGVLPICQHCKKIRDDKGSWNRLETYISKHSEAVFSHGICDKCLKELYPDVKDEMNE